MLFRSDPEWGAMLSMSRSYLSTAPHMVYLPGLVIFVTVLAFNLFGDGLRDTLDLERAIRGDATWYRCI